MGFLDLFRKKTKQVTRYNDPETDNEAANNR